MHHLRSIAVLFLIFAIPLQTVQAAPQFLAYQQELVEWKEIRTRNYAIVYLAEYEELSQLLLKLYGEQLDVEYERLAAFFDTSLLLPVTIRIYQDIQQYYALNALENLLPQDGTHSHIGSREIALIGENITKNPEQWLLEGLNGFRYELAVLFTNKLTNQNAPPGLVAGIGTYTQNPYDFMEGFLKTYDSTLDPDQTWLFLWENESIRLFPDLCFRAASIVSYLVEAYGWGKFTAFLKSLAVSKGYRQSLSEIYQTDFTSLENEWLKYYPLYVQGRWRAHVLYNFDLTVFKELLHAGAYADAEKSLNEAVKYLEKIGETEILSQVKELLRVAKTGLEGRSLVLQARQALQNGQYQQALTLIQQAEEKYAEINDDRYQATLSSYRHRAEEIQSLRKEVERLNNQLSLRTNLTKIAAQLVTAGNRLGELDDAQGRNHALDGLQEIYAQIEKRRLIINFGVVIVVLVLLVLRIRLVRRQAPPEARI